MHTHLTHQLHTSTRLPLHPVCFQLLTDHMRSRRSFRRSESVKTARRPQAGHLKKSIVQKRTLADVTMYVGSARDLASRETSGRC
jgi:hypothetical protein